MAEIIGVSALNKYVRSLLESDPFLGDIAVRGEISNLHHHFATGHRYFTLKDDRAAVKAVLFRSAAQNLAFVPEDGMRVVARCRVSLFERDGAFQLYVEHLFPDGVGAAQMAFEQLKARLETEGLFAPEAKKALPAYPDCVGLVTSQTGAALQDILTVAQRRCPAAQFVLAPVTVQGEAAAGGIAAAIRTLDESGLADVIVIARGGGSVEDLSVFNAEEIARAVFACRTPVVSAVGHEVDYTILDFVADLRAPTPSAAAEMVLPDLWALLGGMLNIYTNLYKNMHFHLNSCYNEWEHFYAHPAFSHMAGLPLREAAKLDDMGRRLQRAVGTTLQKAQERLAHAAALAGTLNPYAVLARGYAIVQDEAGQPLRSIAQARAEEDVAVVLADGKLQCRIREIQAEQENTYG